LLVRTASSASWLPSGKSQHLYFAIAPARFFL
jgi:hypothetical protein